MEWREGGEQKKKKAVAVVSYYSKCRCVANMSDLPPDAECFY